MTAESTDRPSQELRDRFGAAIDSNDIAAAQRLLADEPALASADLRTAEDRDDGFTSGYPLFRACQRNHEELAELLLNSGADPDAPGNNPDDQPELGMPLHFAVHERNYQLAHRLLDHGATPNGYPHCDQSTVERAFYQAHEAGACDSIIRRAYARFLPDRDELESQTVTSLVGADAAEPIKLFARMVDLGGQPPFCAIVRDGFDDLVMEIVQHSRKEEGTPHDHPNSDVFSNILGAARWYGYPKLVRKLMEQYPDRFHYESAIGTIGVAIGSHNRDGGYPEYREIIVMQLEYLKSHGDLEEALEDPDFKPLYQMATDFTWHENYGFRAGIAKPECYIDLAELFLAWGFGGINHRDPKTGHSPLSAAVRRGRHPGISTYVQWLLDHGADRQESEPEEWNPKAIAREQGLDDILRILEAE